MSKGLAYFFNHIGSIATICGFLVTAVITAHVVGSNAAIGRAQSDANHLLIAQMEKKLDEHATIPAHGTVMKDIDQVQDSVQANAEAIGRIEERVDAVKEQTSRLESKIDRLLERGQ